LLAGFTADEITQLTTMLQRMHGTGPDAE